MRKLRNLWILLNRPKNEKVSLLIGAQLSIDALFGSFNTVLGIKVVLYDSNGGARPPFHGMRIHLRVF